jgi:glycine/serine hydroxymethyltransferase
MRHARVLHPDHTRLVSVFLSLLLPLCVCVRGGSQSTGFIDYDRLEENVKLFRPNLLICGASAYPRDWDYKRLRAVREAFM